MQLWAEGRLDRVAGWALTGLLVVGCILVLKPFLSAILWSIILVFSTWPLFRWLEARCGNRRTPAALLMTLALAVMLIVPLVLLGTSLADNAEEGFSLLRAQIENGDRQYAPPSWLLGLPFLGDALAEYWRYLAANTEQLVSVLMPYLVPLRNAAVASGLSLGRGILEISLSVLVSFFLYRDGERMLGHLQTLSERMFGGRALHLITIAGGTIKSVVYGVIGTAIVQAGLAAVGFLIAGMPAPFVLATLTFFLGLFPMGGPPLVWIPATIWLLSTDHLAGGIFLGLWGLLAISGVDNFVKPYLISKGSNLPFLLVFFGVIGGLLAFGVLGIFLGPVLLAVASVLLAEWTALPRNENPGKDATLE